MKWVADSTGRFGWRPFYEPAELDNECESIISSFLRKKYGCFRPPISTDDLTVLIERDVSDLDLYADLSAEGEDVEGATDFFPDCKPAVRITRELSLNTSLQTRLRTTLAHEYAHVRFHNFLWESSPRRPIDDLAGRISRQRRKIAGFRQRLHGDAPDSRPEALLDLVSRRSIISRRDSILDAPVSDWMEWQAAYAGGAFLMPASLVRNEYHKVPGAQPADLVRHIAGTFDVSPDAARIRLVKLGLTPQE